MAAVRNTFCSLLRDLVGKVLWDFNNHSHVMCKYCLFDLLGATLPVKVAEVTEAETENYFVV